ncbi:hypothetical protein KFL_002790160 [Klebsormidium nitens]|uniref:SF3 helicase domain-containing protein n=1 Tax=Klebsormidium nitens TaxID=105231 RepID=A0A1Y1IDV9_KLENI|nr:hypothetical protein KFL_002790160 [Klebsormidium nitens]|eukprot:GAQ86268.1 hypothetical protein KFL_002790160 [Klebsormidium nitens]
MGASTLRLGEIARYTVDGGGELPPAEDLPPLPKWLIGILNERVARGSGERARRPSEVPSRAESSARASAVLGAPDLTDLGLQQEVVEVMRGMLSSFGDNSSVFSKAELSTVAGLGVVMYHWRNGAEGRVCPYAEDGAQPHSSNNFGLLRRGTEITYVCHSQRCKTGDGCRNKRLGRLMFPVAASFSDAFPLNSDRDRLYKNRELLPLWFLRQNLSVLAGDEGGALIIDRLQTYAGRNLVFCNEKWFYYNGSIWVVDVAGRVASQICRGELNKISKAYKKETASEAEGGGSQAEEEKRPRKEKLVNFNFNAKMSQIMTTLKGYCLEPAFEEALNTNRDALPLQNGVVLLESGILVAHHPKYLWSFKLPVRWPSTGLATPLGKTGDFLRQITHTPEALAYLQRILEYGFTGHISNQVMLTMIGEGGAGKSLLLALLKRVIGPFYKDVSKDMLVTSKGQRPLGKGAANPAEAGLRGIRIAVCAESEDTDEFSEANVKRLTGEATITSRALYSDYVTFATTQLHILCSNYPPRVKTWTIALKRRLLTLVFPMRFFYPDEVGYNPDNPFHGIRDLELEDVLKAEPEKLLVFLVQGAKDWYASSKRLLDMPESSKAYMQSWEQEHDPFAAFLQQEGRMNIKAFESTRSLMEAYNNPDSLVDGVRFGDTDAPQIRNDRKFAEACKKKGLESPDKPSALRFANPGHMVRGYRGFQLNTPTKESILER